MLLASSYSEELDAGRIGVRFVAMETNCHPVLDISSGFATQLTS
jgi:hypothetical protein